MDREHEIVSRMGLAKFYARKLFWYNDPLSTAYLALILSVDAYRDDMGTTMETYLRYKIPKTMLDLERKNKFFGRENRRKNLQGSEKMIDSIDYRLFGSNDILARLEVKSLMEAIGKLRDVSTRNFSMFRLHFVDGYTLREISVMFDVTESRCSQIITGIIDKAKKHLT